MIKTVGDYELTKKLGEGMFGTVYKARNVKTGSIHAVKTIAKASLAGDIKAQELFQTETEVMHKFDHPNLLHLFEIVEQDGKYYLVLDYCNNGDMMEYIDKYGALGEDESIYFLMQIMNGFKELNRHKIMHRDFKLANIFLHNDTVVIGDFGFAKSGTDFAST